jgi:hypothetical protein
MARIFLPALLVLPLLASMASPGAADAGQWSIGYGMGTTEANVANDREATLALYCPSAESSDDTPPGMLFDAGAMPAKELAENVSYQATLRIDGQQLPWSFAYIGGKEFQFAAFDPRAMAELTTLIDKLRGGNDLTVAIPDAGVEERFTLHGSGTALDGLMDDCKPK